MSRASIDWNSASREYGNVNFGGDENLVVTFYWKPVIDQQESRQQNIKIFKNVEYVRIMQAGEMGTQVDRPVEEQDKHRFENLYNKFVLKQTQVPEGTPLDVLFPNNPAVAETLKASGIYTVQQLSGLTAHAIDSIGIGGQDYVNRARSYLEAAKSGTEVLKLHRVIKEREAEINSLNHKFSMMQKQMDALLERVNATRNSNDVNGMPTARPTNADIQQQRINNINQERGANKEFKPKPGTIVDKNSFDMPVDDLE